MQPAVALPGKDNAITESPVELFEGVGFAVGAALAFSGVEDFMTLSGGYVGDANGPGQRGAVGDKQQCVLVGREAEKGDARGVGRRGGIGIEIGGGVEVRACAGGSGVAGDEAVVIAIADESHARAVGGPAKLFDR